MAAAESCTCPDTGPCCTRPTTAAKVLDLGWSPKSKERFEQVGAPALACHLLARWPALQGLQPPAAPSLVCPMDPTGAKVRPSLAGMAWALLLRLPSVSFSLSWRLPAAPLALQEAQVLHKLRHRNIVGTCAFISPVLAPWQGLQMLEQFSSPLEASPYNVLDKQPCD